MSTPSFPSRAQIGAAVQFGRTQVQAYLDQNGTSTTVTRTFGVMENAIKQYLRVSNIRNVIAAAEMLTEIGPMITAHPTYRDLSTRQRNIIQHELNGVVDYIGYYETGPFSGYTLPSAGATTSTAAPATTTTNTTTTTTAAAASVAVSSNAPAAPAAPPPPPPAPTTTNAARAPARRSGRIRGVAAPVVVEEKWGYRCPVAGCTGTCENRADMRYHIAERHHVGVDVSGLVKVRFS